MEFFKLKDVFYRYNREDGYAIKGVNLTIYRGQWVSIVGANGSGKSTLAKHLNALLVPEQGVCFVLGMDTKDKDNLWNIRSKVGMVFQNPDNQIVASVVEEDVAFGPENLGVDPYEIRERVDEALKLVGLLHKRKSATYSLSGGEKQRLAIAGVLAMQPECIVMDEPTAMLDPQGRAEVLSVLNKLRVSGMTIVYITHKLEEVLFSDRIAVMNKGELVFFGTPYELFWKFSDRLEAWGLEEPQIVTFIKGLNLEASCLSESIDEVVNRICTKILRKTAV